MMYAVWVPLLMPFVAVPAARRLADALAPLRAVRLLAATAVGLALCSTLALVLLVVPGATQLSAVAAVGELVKPLASAPAAVAVPLALAALAVLAGCTAAVIRTARRHWVELQRARQSAECSSGELAVLRDSRPDAYALPALPGSPGRIVVTTGMLRALNPAERHALLAHERAHLAGRHHLYIAATELAALCHPALRSLRAPMGYALERCADEAAAVAVGDRRVAARAIGRAALAARAAEGMRARPRVALAAAGGPVPRRVAALLGRVTHRPGVGRAAAAALLACLILSGSAALEATNDLHSNIEVAQGEVPQR